MTIKEKNTKTGIHWMLLLSFLIFTMSITGCKHTEAEEMVIPSIGSPKINLYTPTSGGFNTELSLYGNNFGTDLQKIRVTVNGVDAEISGSNGRIVTAKVPKNAGTGPVKLFVDQKEYTFNQQFQYGYQTVVSTYLGSTGADVDGDFSSAKLWGPRYLKWDKNNALYFVEEGESKPDNYAALRMAYNNQVTTLLNASQSPLFERLRGFDFSVDQNTLYISNDNNANGTIGLGKLTRASSGFTNLSTLLTNSGLVTVVVNPITDEVFVALYSGAKICRLNPNGSLTELFAVGSGNITIMDMIFSKDGQTMYISAAYRSHSVYKVKYNTSSKVFNAIELLAGPNANTTGNAEGVGASARFNTPAQMDLDENGNLYVADRKNHCIRKITPDGVVSTYAGVAGTKGLQNGSAKDAKFSDPEGCKFGPDGALYVADTWNNVIRRIAVE